MELLGKARGAEIPESLWSDPLMYQGLSDGFLGPRDPIAVVREDWGIDFEAEIAVVVDHVPMGVAPAPAGRHIKALMLVNDVSLRALAPGELAKGFGFLHSEPASAFSPVAVTPDELGPAWDGGRVHPALVTEVLARMKAAGLGQVPVVVGGIIPPEDAETLKRAGVAAVYTPKDYDLTATLTDLVEIVARGAGRGGLKRRQLLPVVSRFGT